MRYFLKIIMLLLVFFTISASAQDGLEILTKAFESNRKASFKIIIPNQVPPRSYPLDIIVPDTWAFYRQFDGERVNLRLETMQNGKLSETYIENQDGIFGIMDDCSGKLYYVPALWYLEAIHESIDKTELDLANFEVSRETYKQKPCYRVIMNTPSDMASIIALTRESEAELLKNDSERLKYYNANRPFKREFFIDEETYFIYGRNHYSRDGKKLFQLDLVAAEMITPENGLFEFYGDKQKTFLTRDDLASYVLGKREQASVKNTWNYNKIRTYIKWTILVFGTLLIGAAGIVFMLRKKNQKK